VHEAVCRLVVSTACVSLKLTMLVISRPCTILLPAGNDLSGTIPTEIGLLKSLQTVYFSKSIDQFSRFNFGFCLFRYCFLPKLAWKPLNFVISCSYAIMEPDSNPLQTGPIPTEIGLMTSLKYANLGKSIDRFSRAYCRD
jgi:hypothetical protein